MSGRARVVPDTYADSVLLMSATRAMQDADGIEWAAAVMGTEANLKEIREHGVGAPELAEAGTNDLVLAVRAGSDEQANAALEVGLSELSGKRGAEDGRAEAPRPRSIEEAVEALREANVALVSVPGEFAAIEAHKALSGGLHVLLFSDNVPIEQEAELKERAERKDLLVMGPGAGTAMLGGVGLGFANAVQRGPVGVVAAAGTGAQEVMVLIDRWGSGLSEVIGVGGRDLSEEVGGRMTRVGIRALNNDDRTEMVLLVSKPPAPEVAQAMLRELAPGPAVAALIGLREGEVEAPQGVILARTLEGSVLRTLEAMGRDVPDPARGLAERAEAAAAGVEEGRALVRGLFSGGTLCYESMVLLSDHLGPIRSNVPLRKDWGLPAPAGSHICLDLGEEEFTRGRPHPMIDPEPRAERLTAETEDPDVGVILLDLVLGYGAHDDPASVLAPACRVATSVGIAVVAHVLGTGGDPQPYEEQRRTLEEAGVVVAPTGARAALVAGAIAARDPKIAEAPA